jgi:hypothetical protein
MGRNGSPTFHTTVQHAAQSPACRPRPDGEQSADPWARIDALHEDVAAAAIEFDRLAALLRQEIDALKKKRANATRPRRRA